jgi:hypothetical protein
VPGIATRCLEVERWVVIGLIEAMNADPEVRAEVCPRLHPDAIVDGDRAVRVDLRDSPIALTAGDRELLRRCDGATPAHQLGDPAALARLVELGVAVWELERFAVDASPLAGLIADVAGWRDREVRTRWASRLEHLRALAGELGTTDGAPRRRAVIARFRAALAELGVAERDRGRTLYSAGNPISENCFRECGIELGAREVDRLIADASPWFDLFHDAYALAVARAFDRYREVAAAAPRHAGRLSYAALVAFARTRDLDLETDAALVRIANETFAEIKRDLGDALAGRADAPEWELTVEDCHVLRRRHQLPAVDELSYPQADLQLAAASLDELAAGRYTWVVAELHHAFIPLQHLLYWSCPDKPAVHSAMAASLDHKPYAVRGSLTGQPVHIAGEAVLWATPRPTFVGRGRPKPGWRAVRPADAEVVIDDDARDIRLRAPGGDDLGSLIRTFRVLMGMHPFFPFERTPHAPRLRVGGTVVQRRAWTVTSAELGEPRPIGLSPSFVVGVERLRRDRGVPRWVFARARPERYRTYDVLARDKDLKPLYLDLESPLFLEIFERRLRKYGELVVSEMLPAPDQLVWSEPDGRFVFELRTSVVPR